MTVPERFRPGDGVRVAPAYPGRHRGRMGVVVEADGDDVVVRFSTVRTFTFCCGDLKKVVSGVRRGS